jgi:flagellar protein FlaG
MNVSNVGMSSAVQAVPVSATVAVRDHSRQGQEEVSVAKSNDEVKQMVASIQNHISEMNVSLEFSTYGDHGEKVAVIVTNKETGELIREIPSREIQNLYAKMSELAGMIFNKEI